jgi:hypothetical protein
VELLLDTDFLIKMGRYHLLDDFEKLMTSKGHQQPYRHLAEVSGRVAYAKADPIRSDFGSVVAHNIVRSFIGYGTSLGQLVNRTVVNDLDTIPGVDYGEQLLVEYALRANNSVIITADKNFIKGLGRNDIAMSIKYRPRLINRVHHLEHVLWELAQLNGWPAIQKAITKDPRCDNNLFAMLSTTNANQTQATINLSQSINMINRDGNGTTPATL